MVRRVHTQAVALYVRSEGDHGRLALSGYALRRVTQLPLTCALIVLVFGLPGCRAISAQRQWMKTDYDANERSETLRPCRALFCFDDAATQGWPCTAWWRVTGLADGT